MPSFDKQEYSDELFKKCDFSKSLHQGIRFYDCTFEDCDFTEAVLSQCRLRDCEFVNCNLSVCSIPDSTFSGAKFVDSKVVGINWTAATWPKVRTGNAMVFERSTVSYGCFAGLDISETAFTQCRAVEADFSEADCSDCSFRSTDLAGAVFHNTKLNRADFIDASNYAINIFKNDIRRARFSLPEASLLLECLDIELEE